MNELVIALKCDVCHNYHAVASVHFILGQHICACCYSLGKKYCDCCSDHKLGCSCERCFNKKEVD
jgi:hypothetical protein